MYIKHLFVLLFPLYQRHWYKREKNSSHKELYKGQRRAVYTSEIKREIIY
jgi:hypothetical protein